MTTDAIAQLINIFKTQAEKEKDEATLQRVLRENVQAERVLNETMATPTSPTNEPLAGPTSPQTTNMTTYPPLEIEEYPKMDVGTLHQLSIQKTTPIHHDRQPTYVTSVRFEQSHRTTYFT